MRRLRAELTTDFERGEMSLAIHVAVLAAAGYDRPAVAQATGADPATLKAAYARLVRVAPTVAEYGIDLPV